MFWKFMGIFITLAALANFGDSAVKESQTGMGQKQSDYSFCGQTFPRSNSRVKRVIGGKDARENAWPWQVLILNLTSVFCSGSIISPTFLITAAHCVDKANSSYLKFYVGKHHVGKKDQHEKQLQVKQIIIHPKYRRGNQTDPGDNDIALVKLKDPIKFTDRVSPICLADARKFKAGHECVLSGWGITDTLVKATANTLQQLRLPLVSKKVCNSKESYGGIIHQRYLCAGVPEGGKDACFYDSGGPLSCANSKTEPWYLVGIVVWGDGCAKRNKYGVYANVTKFMSMIKSNVKDLPRPYSATQNPSPAQTSSKDKDKMEDENKEKIFIAIIASLCVIIVILLTTLCIVNFYSRGYICCTPTDKVTTHHKVPRILHEQNGKLNGEVSV